MIDMPRGPMRDYLRALGLYAIYTTTDGRAHAAAAPAGDIASIKWTTQRGARAMAARLNKGTFKTIEAAAAGLRFSIAEHADVLERARDAVRKVNTALAHAKAQGELRAFHRAFVEVRAKAVGQGIRPQSYARAYMRLRAALFVYASRGEDLPSIAELIDTVVPTPPSARQRAIDRKKKLRPPAARGRDAAGVTPKFTLS
jgi:hypothetical protein